MAFDQKIASAVTAFVALAAGVTGVLGSRRGPVHSAQLPSDTFPHVVITPVDGLGTLDHMITNTNEYNARVALTLYYKTMETTDSQAEDLLYEIDDALAAGAFQLGGTCVSCLPVDGAFSGWASENYKFYDRTYIISYWRDANA